MFKLCKKEKGKISNGLYVILDKELAGDRNLIRLAEEVIKGGADALQLRDKVSSARLFFKDAEVVCKVARHHGIHFIVNDRADIAAAVEADGVHIGQDDLPLDDARKILGKSGLIGISCHSFEQALMAWHEGADYIGLGPIFKTRTRPALDAIGPGLIRKVRESIDIPVVCIGGIDINNIGTLISAGARSVAIASAIIKSERPGFAARQIKGVLEKMSLVFHR